jgi:hypothetical protein
MRAPRRSLAMARKPSVDFDAWQRHLVWSDIGRFLGNFWRKTMKPTLDVFVEKDRVAFAADRTWLGQIPAGWRFSRTIDYDPGLALPGSNLAVILAGVEKFDFYIPSDHA